jgi:hypothetical protein
MKNEQENNVVHLPRSGIKPPPTRIMQHVSSPKTSGAVLLSAKQVAVFSASSTQKHACLPNKSADLTSSAFSVTRARAHAQARASAYAYAHARKDEGALRRVLDAALNGGDVRVAAVKPSSALVRFFAWLLIPAMLVAPLAPAYANEAPLADRVASDVAAIVGDVGVASASASDNVAAIANASVGASPTSADVAPSADSSTSSADQTVSSPVVSVPENATATSTSVTTQSGASGGSSATGVDTSPANTAATNTPTVSSSGTSSGSSATIVASSTATIVNSNGTSTASSTIAVDDSTQTDTMASTTADGETPIFDVAPDVVIGNVDAIRAKLRNEMRGELRDEVRNEVKNEVRKEVEEEVYRGCKNLDGTGYYCIPDAKAFGSPVIANERSISVVVQPDPITGNKQIFLVRNASTIQLTHGTDDNVFPVLDPSSDMLVWQSLQGGHWQVAYAHMDDVGVPKVSYLTKGENNFNPKIYSGRIAWQAWVDGNWEIFTATPTKEKIPDDALSAEHRAAGVDGNWLVKRITANNVPDMFPNVTGDTITWQAIDGGVWQVFAYDIATGVSHRVSKPGVKSDSPKVALVWNEQDANGQMRMVGSSVDGTESFDLSALARRLVDNTKQQPKSPVSNTEIVVVAPTVVRTESDATTTPVVN